jgi:hypothetical protein
VEPRYLGSKYIRRRFGGQPLGRRVAAIRYAHKLAGHPVPTDDVRVKDGSPLAHNDQQ